MISPVNELRHAGMQWQRGTPLLGLRICPVSAVSRAAYGHSHRARWLRCLRATVELLGLSRSH